MCDTLTQPQQQQTTSRQQAVYHYQGENQQHVLQHPSFIVESSFAPSYSSATDSLSQLSQSSLSRSQVHHLPSHYTRLAHNLKGANATLQIHPCSEQMFPPSRESSCHSGSVTLSCNNVANSDDPDLISSHHRFLETHPSSSAASTSSYGDFFPGEDEMTSCGGVGVDRTLTIRREGGSGIHYPSQHHHNHPLLQQHRHQHEALINSSPGSAMLTESNALAQYSPMSLGSGGVCSCASLNTSGGIEVTAAFLDAVSKKGGLNDGTGVLMSEMMHHRMTLMDEEIDSITPPSFSSPSTTSCMVSNVITESGNPSPSTPASIQTIREMMTMMMPLTKTTGEQEQENRVVRSESSSSSLHPLYPSSTQCTAPMTMTCDSLSCTSSHGTTNVVSTTVSNDTTASSNCFPEGRNAII